MKRILLCALLAQLSALSSSAQAPSLTAFSYQGRLNAAGTPANGAYDLRFELFDVETGGAALGLPVERAAVNAANGLFTTELDFGGAEVFNGTQYWLGISVKPAGGPDYTELTPRQPVRPVPYAIFSMRAGSVADGSITSAALAAGAVTGPSIAGGSIGLSHLSTTGAPATGMVLAFDGANLTWVTPGPGGGGGGGSLTLPYSGLASSPGSLFSVNNMNATGDAWAIYGHSQTSLGVFGQTHGNSSGVLGRADGTSGGSGVFGYSSGAGLGMLAVSEGNDGISARTNANNKAAVAGYTEKATSIAGSFLHAGNGTAVQADTGSGWGVFGRSQSGIGVFGQSINGGTGVLGRNESATGQAVHGYSPGGSNGVRGDSGTGDGVVGVSGGAGKSGVVGINNNGSAIGGITGLSSSGTAVFGKTDSGAATAAFFWNSGGGDAIRTDGAIRVGGRTVTRVLEITGGADVAEPFDIRQGDTIPAGSVVVIDEHGSGSLEMSRRAYDTRVAGIVSGANGINPGLCLSQEGVNDGGRHVALSGRVYCLCDAKEGEIKPGDLLTTSDTPGHAMKVADSPRGAGAILGKAMSRLAKGEKGHVLVLVSLQ